MRIGISKIIISTFILLIIILTGCKQYDNFTTYFNTYYNAQRIMDESEDEFEFQDEKKRITPRVFVPEPKFHVTQYDGGIAPFMQEFVISQKKLQPVKVKLDSITIKGSKILARHPKSNYVEGTLFLMAKSYFYQSLWLPSQIKCSELVDRFPDGDLVPDALLLMTKNLLMQMNYPSGKIMLSRTIDFAWQKKRWDILSEAFRIEAELALLDNDIEGAIRPYRQAIAQSENEEMRAKWQVDMASIYYRNSRFKEAERAFAKTHKFSPDYMAQYEAYLYQALSLIRLGDTLTANRILDKLDNDGKFEEWKNYVVFARMTKERINKQTKQLEASETFADSAYMNNTAINAVYFEKAVDSYNERDYGEARRYFSRARNKRSMFSQTSNQMFFLLNSWDQKISTINLIRASADSNQVLSDTSKMDLARQFFELGRIHEEMGNIDSTKYYYLSATEYSPPEDTLSARYIYAFARVIRDSSVWVADSLLEVLADNYTRTEYGKDAMKQLGYTDNFLIDNPYEIYKSGNSLRRNKEYDMSISQFLSLVEKFPDYKLSPKALYSVGWIWENDLKDIDSALYYYHLLIKKYPNSEYTQDIVSGVNYLTSVKKGSIKPGETLNEEYFKAPTLNLDEISNRTVLTPAEKNPNINKNGSFNPLDIITDPGKALNKVIDSFKEAGSDIEKQVNETFEEVKDPSKVLKNMKLPKFDIPGVEINPTDSTKKKNPIPPKEENEDKPPK